MRQPIYPHVDTECTASSKTILYGLIAPRIIFSKNLCKNLFGYLSTQSIELLLRQYQKSKTPLTFLIITHDIFYPPVLLFEPLGIETSPAIVILGDFCATISNTFHFFFQLVIKPRSARITDTKLALEERCRHLLMFAG